MHCLAHLATLHACVCAPCAGHGLAHSGQPFINPGGGQPIYFGGPTAQQPAFPTPLKPARKLQVASGAVYLLNLGYGNCRVDDISGYVSSAAHQSSRIP
jgi:hypothetical protein